MDEFHFPTDYSVKDVDLSKKQEQELAEYICKEVDLALRERAPLERKWKLWLQQMNSRRKRADAGPRDSQIDLGITQERAQQARARLLNPVFQQDRIYTTIARKPSVEEDARAYEDLLDIICDRVDFLKVCDEWIEQAQTFSCGVVKVPWTEQRTKIRRWREASLDEMYDAEEQGMNVLTVGQQDYIEEEYEFTERDGSFPIVIPVEDFIFPITAESIDLAKWVCHRVWLTKDQVKARIADGIYREKINGDKTMDVLGKPSVERDKLMDVGEGKDKPEDSSKQYEVLEVYISYDVDKTGPTELIVTMDRESKKILRAVHNFYQCYPRPFVTFSHKAVIGSIYGIPLAYILEPIHVAYSAAVNQRLDQASKANESIIITRTGSDLMDKLSDGLRGGIVETNEDPNEIKQFQLTQGGYTQLPELEMRLLQHADKRASLSEYLFGNETTERPTATGQVQLIEEAKQPLYVQLERFRTALSLVAKMMLGRYRQFSPGGMEFYQGTEAGELQQVLFKWPTEAFEESVIIETKVSSQSMSKNVRKQEIVALVDKIPQLYQMMMQLSGEAANPNSPMSPVAMQLLHGFQTVVDQFLTEFDVARKQELNPDLVQGVQIAQQIQGLMQQVQQLGMQNQQLQAQLSQMQNALPRGPQVPRPPGPPPGVPGPSPVPGPPVGP